MGQTCGLLVATQMPVQSVGAATQHAINTHSADAEGFYVNSYIVVGNDDLTLIDAQLNAVQAAKLVSLIKSFDKPLKNIVITHSHPDHYLGLEFIAPSFPDAKVVSAERSIEVMKKTAEFWVDFKNEFQDIKSGKYILSGLEMECSILPDAESLAPLVLYIPDQKTLISGDHALEKQHLWLAEGRGEAWIENIMVLQEQWEIARVLPGHGKIGDVEVLDQTKNYIEDFLKITSSCDAQVSRQKMLELYPDHRFTEALDVSLQVYCRS